MHMCRCVCVCAYVITLKQLETTYTIAKIVSSSWYIAPLITITISRGSATHCQVTSQFVPPSWDRVATGAQTSRPCSSGVGKGTYSSPLKGQKPRNSCAILVRAQRQLAHGHVLRISLRELARTAFAQMSYALLARCSCEPGFGRRFKWFKLDGFEMF